MSLYKVINRFRDRDGHIYEVGQPYPADGKKLNEQRAEFLTKKHSKYGVAFLEKVEIEEKAEENKQSETPKKATTTRRTVRKVTKSTGDESEQAEKSDE